MPKVSILIPSYQHAAFLPACLDSVLSQTETDWELVLVDDGSQDSSVENARAYAQKDPRIAVHVNETNRGTYGTLQRALELSQADLIAVLNSDDLWHPEKLTQQLRTLENHPDASCCYTLGWMVDERGTVIEEDVHADWPTGEIQDLLPHLLRENRVLASSVVFRRQGLNFHPECRYSGDWVALLEAVTRGPATCVPDRLNFWRQHSTNTYRRSLKQVAEEIWIRQAIEDVGPAWMPEGLSDAARLQLAMNAINLQALWVLLDDGAKARAAVNSAKKWVSESPVIRKRAMLSGLPMALQRRRLWPGEPPLERPALPDKPFQFNLSK